LFGFEKFGFVGIASNGVCGDFGENPGGHLA